MHGPKQAHLMVLAALTVFSAGAATGQQTEPSGPRIEPASLQALTAMGDHLQKLTTFQLMATTTTEIILDTDQKLEIGGTATYEVRRPDRLRIDLATDVVHGELVYDGKTLVYASPDQKTYAQVPAPSTIKDMLEHAARKYDLAFPLADLFSWGTPDAPTDLIREGFLVGYAYVGDKPAAHWAYRGVDQDAEIWIATDGSPLPLKISLVDREDLTRPRITSVLEWNENAAIDATAFTYTPPEGAQRIRFLNEEIAK